MLLVNSIVSLRLLRNNPRKMSLPSMSACTKSKIFVAILRSCAMHRSTPVSPRASASL
jgi:hypothetical protein